MNLIRQKPGFEEKAGFREFLVPELALGDPRLGSSAPWPMLPASVAEPAGRPTQRSFSDLRSQAGAGAWERELIRHVGADDGLQAIDDFVLSQPVGRQLNRAGRPGQRANAARGVAFVAGVLLLQKLVERDLFAARQ